MCREGGGRETIKNGDVQAVFTIVRHSYMHPCGGWFPRIEGKKGTPKGTRGRIREEDAPVAVVPVLSIAFRLFGLEEGGGGRRARQTPAETA